VCFFFGKKVMYLSALESGQVPNKKSTKKQDSDTAFNQIIINRLGEIHEDIGKVHARVDDLARDTANAIAEMVKVQANSLTKEDCKECKDDREKVEEKRRGVSPKAAYILIPLIVGCLSVLGQNLRYIWHAFLVLVRGG
jgi:hypothetical protein